MRALLTSCLAVFAVACVPMAIPPLEIQAAGGVASQAAGPASPGADKLDERGNGSVELRYNVRAGTTLLQGFTSQKNRRFDFGAGFIRDEAIASSIANVQPRYGWYARISYYPHIGIEPFMDIRDPIKFMFLPMAMHAFPRVRLGLHLNGDVFSFDALSTWA